MLKRIQYKSVSFNSPEKKQTRGILLIFLALLFPYSIKAQTTSYGQSNNELQFSRALNGKWAIETYLGGAYSQTPTEDRILKTNIQRYIQMWGHYYFTPRWKFSGSLAYFYNKDVPDIGQYFSPEYRLSLQGMYFFHKTGYTLVTRMRGELRYMMNADGDFEDKYRYRQMIKFMKPLNSQVLRQGIFYFVTTEEVLLKPNAKTMGINFFDRNRFEIGGGYLITDDLQLEMTYVNEFMPRDNGNELYNVLSLTVTVNNLFLKLKDKLTHKSAGSEKND
jgi:hypothetical protein